MALIYVQAIQTYTTLLSLLPHNPNIIREIYPLLMEPTILASTPSTSSTALDLLRSSFAHFRTTFPNPQELDESTSLTVADLIQMVDLLVYGVSDGETKVREGLEELKKNVRWMQLRVADEGLWERFAKWRDDDREFVSSFVLFTQTSCLSQ
jgi:general transcription factor 3C polypeptide 3 (transcription factor C subunit 4)